MFRIRSRHRQGQETRQNMIRTIDQNTYNHIRGRNACISPSMQWQRIQDISDTSHSRYTCSKFLFDWSRSKVTSHEVQSSYSPSILILSEVFSPKLISVTVRIFFIHGLSFLVIGQEIWALRMMTKVLLRPISLPVTGIFMNRHTSDPTHIPCTCSELSCNRRSKDTSHEGQSTPPLQAAGTFMKTHT